MKRYHLFEILDWPWIPQTWRDACTGYLELISRVVGLDRVLAPILEQYMLRHGHNRILDLCSGGAGPIIGMAKQWAISQPSFRISLSDFFPNITAFHRAKNLCPSNLSFLSYPVDASAVPSELQGVRLLSNAFHHFSPLLARKIVANAIDNNAPLVVVELSVRKPINLASFFVIPILALFAIPFVRPFRWNWLLFTYVIPVIPFIMAWDGLASHLRTYSKSDWENLLSGIDQNKFHWQYEEISLLRVPSKFSIVFITPSSRA